MSISEIALFVFGVPTFIASCYAGWRRIRSNIADAAQKAEDAAYARLKSETVLATALETIEDKDRELADKTTAVVELASRMERQQRVEDEQRATIALLSTNSDRQLTIIEQLSSALHALGGDMGNQERAPI